ncbi:MULTISPECIES: 3'-5' exonuclease [unclassified Acinetobacter]|uniref:3'-5' exonuclease n=1 Tax=unclassified Acinetobacter TaxID=196816 RepID=UPI00190B485E|nr:MULTISPECIES: 3'-5' exonuclease [unclassified Acinetobacter]MBK0062588.1 3'-5' exonuclease [Acinetobacter sp. S55]MBK0065835.1 3'-5' exonuclease [Acinetobacter sp. S54]
MTALIFDVETHKLHGDIIEVAYQGVEFLQNRFLLKMHEYRFNQRYKPSEQIDISAMAIHLIADEDLEKSPSFKEFNFPEDLIPEYLIGHNIDYDIDAIARAGCNTKHIKRICTLAMSRYLWPELESHKLPVVALYVSKNRSMTAHELRFAHCAAQDCDITFNVLQAIIQHQNINSIEELYQFSELARVPTHIFWGKWRGRRIFDLETKQIKQLLENETDKYLLTALNNELTDRIRPR